MKSSTRTGLASLAVAGVLVSTQVYAQMGSSVPTQLDTLNSNVLEISNQLAGLSASLEQGLAGQTATNFVEVKLNVGSDACENVGTKFDTMLLSDGSEVDFEIPPEHVLVVTEIELLGFGANPGADVQTRIFRGVGLSVNQPAIRESTADADGRIFHFYEFNPGIIVANGGEICTNNNLNITTSGYLRGYLARL